MTTTSPAIRADAADHLTRCQAAADLAAVREQWGDLLTAISRRPRAEWPPRDNIAALLAVPAAADDEPTGPTIGRIPLTLREHPAPLNLDALDAACQVERDLFELADRIAAAVQRPVRRRPDLSIVTGRPPRRRPRMVVDRADRDDPARWIYAAPTSPGSRAYGLHWAAVWVEGRVCGEDTGDLFRSLPPLLLDEAAATARRARARVERALNRDGQPTPLDDPCPWCSGQLTAHTRSGDPHAAVIVCGTGEGCGAPVVLDHGRRVWQRETLAGLWAALDAARKRA
ncbi:hypothetical protein [Streptomyces sp. NPDC056188]|uniref:hypothetical protein n=1 Tax=Streptomyces sp. NPDC056188 TaxID=3345740 RepID=UPI0035E0AA16